MSSEEEYKEQTDKLKKQINSLVDDIPIELVAGAIVLAATHSVVDLKPGMTSARYAILVKTILDELPIALKKSLN